VRLATWPELLKDLPLTVFAILASPAISVFKGGVFKVDEKRSNASSSFAAFAFRDGRRL